MEQFVDRARGAMNLILILSLILLWAGLRPPPTSSLVLASDISLPLQRCIAKNCIAWRFDRAGGDFANPTTSTKVAEYLTAVSLHLSEIEDSIEERALKEAADDPEVNAETIRRNLSQAYEEVRSIVLRRVQELKQIHEPFKDEKFLTFQDLDEEIQHKVKIPFLDKEVPAESALILISLGLTAPYLYLMSICWGMRGVSDAQVSEGSLSWIFFHPNNMGFWLGSAWLGLPIIALVLSNLLRNADYHDALWWVYMWVLALGAGALVQAWFARQYIKSLRRIKEVPWKPEAPPTE